MNMHEKFRMERIEGIAEQGKDEEARRLSQAWISHPGLHQYSYNFSWMGRPIIQYPQDIVAMQELIFTVQPDLIIETGIAHGGSLILYASLLELNAMCGGQQNFSVLGIDIDIRAHNREAIEAHPIFQRGHITMLEGSSIDADMVAKVHKFAAPYKRIMVLLDSNHTHEHVFSELTAYAPLVSVDSYCVVFDTVIENMAADAYPDRPWGKGNNPMTAAGAYLASHPEYVCDEMMDSKLLISVAPKGFLKRIA
ncbi:MAG: cephalosporin hydroxylase [Deltaproteobacteria bacterium]|nr:cephalosporin hydroxylase [Deltaproteobacteria bacterium]